MLWTASKSHEQLFWDGGSGLVSHKSTLPVNPSPSPFAAALRYFLSAGTCTHFERHSAGIFPTAGCYYNRRW